MYPKKIYLVGMPGSGKSTFGKLLAEKIDRQFFDLDEQIEKMSGMKIPDIFKEAGEDQFRMFESYALGMMSQLNEPALISTGGGTPCFNGNMELMNETGSTIFLNTPIQKIVKRVGQDKSSRPLISDTADEDIEKSMMSLLDKRIGFYEQADFTSDSDLKEILSYLSAH